MSAAQHSSTAPTPTRDPFSTSGWLRRIRDDERFTLEEKDLAIQIATQANENGRGDATLPQLRGWLCPREDGSTASIPTIKRRRARLVQCGYLELVKQGGMGIGRGYGSEYQLTIPSAQKGIT